MLVPPASRDRRVLIAARVPRVFVARVLQHQPVGVVATGPRADVSGLGRTCAAWQRCARMLREGSKPTGRDAPQGGAVRRTRA